MDRLDTLDWSLIRTFLYVAETGSLSEAGRQLGLAQPTVGRQIRQIEAALDLALFTRQPRGLSLTDAGRVLLPRARRMQDAAREIGLSAAGRSERLAGCVRVTTSVAASQYHLPRILAGLREEEPDIQIELVASDRSENLLYRDADVALRLYRSEQLDIVTQYLGDLEMGFYAARSFVARHGMPAGTDAALALDMVGLDRDEALLRGMRALGIPAQRDWFATRCDDHAVIFELIRAGCGAGVVQCSIAEQCPDLVRIPVDVPIPPLPVYLAAHEGLRHTPRIRRVWDALGEGMRPHLVRAPVS